MGEYSYLDVAQLHRDIAEFPPDPPLWRPGRIILSFWRWCYCQSREAGWYTPWVAMRLDRRYRAQARDELARTSRRLGCGWTERKVARWRRLRRASRVR